MVSSPCAVIPSGSEIATPILLEPTSKPKTRPRLRGRDVSADWVGSEGTRDYKPQRKNRKKDYDAGMATSEAMPETTSAPAVAPPVPPQRRHWAMNVVGITGILALCYFGESVLVVMLVSMLLAFILAPIVDLLSYIRLPRGLAAAIAILLLLAALCGIVYFSYNQAATLLQDLPKYTSKVRDEASRFRK